MPRISEIVGKKFNMLTVIRKSDKRNKNRIKWVCKCDCGNYAEVETGNLSSGSQKSCGCIKSEMISKSRTTHGMSKSPEYKTWHGIKYRCYSSNYKEPQYYQEKGITMCDRWLHSFENFYEDMGQRPSKSHSIDRIDSNGNYEPSNCRWATKEEQSSNTSRNILVDHNGEKITLMQLSKIKGVNYGSLNSAIKRGTDLCEALKRLQSLTKKH